MASIKVLLRLFSERQRILALKAVKDAPSDYVVEIHPPKRSTEQNARLWAMLTEIARQVRFHVRRDRHGWAEAYLTPEEVKDILTAAFHRHQDLALGIDGGVVFLGMRTSKMDKGEMAEFQTLIEAFAAEKGVTFPWEEGGDQPPWATDEREEEPPCSNSSTL
jgi:hypothetical protein